MALRLLVLAMGLVAMVAPALADENESSETTVLARLAAGATSGLGIGGAGVSSLPHSAAPSQSALALPEPEMQAIAPYSGCHKAPGDTVYLTN